MDNRYGSLNTGMGRISTIKSNSDIDVNKIKWTVACVGEFARYKTVDMKSSFRYLYEFGGIEFLKDHYEAEHTLSFNDAVEDLDIICKRNGGDL